MRAVRRLICGCWTRRMADLVELSDAEHLFEYARQMVRCDAEMETQASTFGAFLEGDQARMISGLDWNDQDAARDELDKLAEMVAGLTAQRGEE